MNKYTKKNKKKNHDAALIIIVCKCDEKGDGTSGRDKLKAQEKEEAEE